jgi:hypothetical protein
MIKKIIILAIFLVIVLFSGKNNLVLACAGAAVDCDSYCASPCTAANPGGSVEPDGVVCICNPIPHPDFEALIVAATAFIFQLATFIFPLMIVIAAFYFITAGANPANIEKAKKVLIYSSIGYGIIILANALVYVIKSFLGFAT